MKREFFLPAEVKSEADYDTPVPIGYGQTNSQPTTVRMMMRWLEPQRGEKIMDVGSGSSWTTAIIAELVGDSGFVFAVEKVPELVKFGRQNLKKVHVKNAEVHQAQESLGLKEQAPFDRILVSAAARNLPLELIEQLKIGGRMVVPVKNSIYVINKINEENYDSIEYPGFVFVPLL